MNARIWAPLTGVVFVAMLIAGAVIVGETPDATEDSAQEVLDFYSEDDDTIALGSLLWGLGSVFLLFFAGWLRSVLRAAEGEGGVLSAVSLAGAIVLAVGLASSAAFTFAVADVADNIDDPIVFQTLNVLTWGYWIPFAAGVITFMVANGISIIRHGAFAAWLGWVAIVAGVLMFTPAFIVAAPIAGLWVLAVSVIGIGRARGATS
jgi:hypothetical protein